MFAPYSIVLEFRFVTDINLNIYVSTQVPIGLLKIVIKDREGGSLLYFVTVLFCIFIRDYFV